MPPKDVECGHAERHGNRKINAERRDERVKAIHERPDHRGLPMTDRLTRYMFDDAERWLAVHGRITALAEAVAAIAGEVLGQGSRARIVSALDDLEATPDRHIAGREELLLMIAALSVPPVGPGPMARAKPKLRLVE